VLAAFLRGKPGWVSPAINASSRQDKMILTDVRSRMTRRVKSACLWVDLGRGGLVAQGAFPFGGGLRMRGPDLIRYPDQSDVVV
jgi:hypothetical protein